MSAFYTNLATLLDKHKFSASQIWSANEIGTKTVPVPTSVVDKKGKRQVGSIASGERGELVTTVCAVNVKGQFIPPLLIFPQKRYQNLFLKRAPVSSIGAATKSGWINDDIWYQCLEHFVTQTSSSKEKPNLLIIDNHSSHINYKSVEMADKNGVVLSTIWSHTSHKLQPLDVFVYGPFKRYHHTAINNWTRSHPGERFGIYNVASAVNNAFLSAMTPRNIIAGFRATGIYPYDSINFGDRDFASCLLAEKQEELLKNPLEQPRIEPWLVKESFQQVCEARDTSSLREWLNSGDQEANFTRQQNPSDIPSTSALPATPRDPERLKSLNLITDVHTPPKKDIRKQTFVFPESIIPLPIAAQTEKRSFAKKGSSLIYNYSSSYLGYYNY